MTTVRRIIHHAGSNVTGLLLAWLIILSGCGGRESMEPNWQPPADIQPGDSRQQVRNALGEPDEMHVFTKQQEYVWGPQESFWHEIPFGTRLEVWHYRSEEGILSLYFREQSATVTYTAWAPEGVDY